MENLTSLDNVKDWCGATTANDDDKLNRLISNASRFILSYLQRQTFLYSTNTEYVDGYETTRMYPRPYPLLSLTSLTIGTQSIPIVSNLANSCGAFLEPWNGIPPGSPQAISLRGFRFCRGFANIILQYTSGYVVQNEAATVEASDYTYTVNAPYGNWADDVSVKYASTGIALTRIPIGGAAPSSGQYCANDGIYAFSSAMANVPVLISYSFIPADIEQACIELVGERYSYKDRIGQVSKTLGGQETMAFSQKNMPDFIKDLLRPYNSTIL